MAIILGLDFPKKPWGGSIVFPAQGNAPSPTHVSIADIIEGEHNRAVSHFSRTITTQTAIHALRNGIAIGIPARPTCLMHTRSILTHVPAPVPLSPPGGMCSIISTITACGLQRPNRLVWWGGKAIYLYTLYGELPGTQSVIREGVDATTGESVAYVMIANKVNSGAGKTIDDNIRSFLPTVTHWPTIDSFNYVYACSQTMATISDHVTAGRVYSQSDSGACDPVVRYYAVGSDENLGGGNRQPPLL